MAAKRPPYSPPSLEAPPVYTPGPNPAIGPFLQGRRRAPADPGAEVPLEVVASKASPAYRAHSYHTKVPPEGVAPFLQRYTRPGQVVLDPFCGSGMTGVAALEAGRRAVLVDLSPAATFIAYNYCARPDPDRLAEEARRVLAAAGPQLEPLYTTRCRACGQPAPIRFTVWSERYACPECAHRFALWDVARQGRRVAADLACPACGRTGQRGTWERLEPVPVRVAYRCPQCRGREDPPEERDTERIRDADRGGWEARVPYPRTPIPARGDEIARVHKRGIDRVDELFTRRNLRAVATLWQAAAALPDLACRRHLLFALTAAMPRASRTNKYIPALGIAPGPILGTMYIPGLHPEVNVLALFRRKVADAVRYYRAASDAAGGPLFDRRPEHAVRVSTQSATDLGNVPDGSIDYAFTDPPFGSNIAYSELNLLWESWLGVRTPVAEEAIVSRAQGKSIEDYGGMIAAAFGEVRRVLRRGGRLSVVFHNASAEVWRALQAALADAAFAVESVVTFDKGPNQSFKQFTTDGAVTHDLVVTCKRGPRRASLPVASGEELSAFLREAVAGAGGEASARQLYSAAIAHFLRRGVHVPYGFAQFRQFLADR
ncbi:MAG: DNA methyltransferase [Candidatus Brocadiia bacterium]